VFPGQPGVVLGVGLEAGRVAAWQKGGKLSGLPLGAKATDEGPYRVITIAKLLGDVLHRPLLHEDGAQSLVLAVERVGGFEKEGMVGCALHDSTSVRCGGIILGITNPGRMLKGEMPLRKVRSRGRGCRFSGSKGGLAEEDHSEGGADRGGQNQARYPEIAHKNLPEQPELTRKRGVPLQRLWGIFAPRKSAVNVPRQHDTGGSVYNPSVSASNSVPVRRDHQHAPDGDAEPSRDTDQCIVDRVE
jgi:hypothetical protein